MLVWLLCCLVLSECSVCVWNTPLHKEPLCGPMRLMLLFHSVPLIKHYGVRCLWSHACCITYKRWECTRKTVWGPLLELFFLPDCKRVWSAVKTKWAPQHQNKSLSYQSWEAEVMPDTVLTSHETIKRLGGSHSCESDNGMIHRLITKTNTESSTHTVGVAGGSTKYNYLLTNLFRKT